MSNQYKSLLRSLHAALDTGNPSDASETLAEAVEAFAQKQITFEQLAEIRADFKAVYPHYQE